MSTGFMEFRTPSWKQESGRRLSLTPNDDDEEDDYVGFWSLARKTRIEGSKTCRILCMNIIL